MNEYDAQELAYKNGYTEGFLHGMRRVENWLEKYPITQVLEILKNKEVLTESLKED